MTTVTIRETKALQVTAGFLTKPIIYPCPRTNVIPVEKANAIITDVFAQVIREYGIIEDADFHSVNPNELSSTLQRVLKHVTRRYDVEKQCWGCIRDSFPDSELQASKTSGGVIYSQRVVLQITRLLLQTMFDLLGEMRSNFCVNTPFKPGCVKWESVVSEYTPSSVDAVTRNIRVDERAALRLDGAYFTTPVVVPTPNTYQLLQREAKQITRDTFDAVLSNVGISQFSSTPYEDFKPIQTTVFVETLYNVLTNAVDEHCDRDTATVSDRVIDELQSVFPPDKECSEYPDMIYAADVIVHITWMVLQTWFDLLSKHESNVSVTNPFMVTNHMWTATRNGECNE